MARTLSLVIRNLLFTVAVPGLGDRRCAAASAAPTWSTGARSPLDPPAAAPRGAGHRGDRGGRDGLSERGGPVSVRAESPARPSGTATTAGLARLRRASLIAPVLLSARRPGPAPPPPRRPARRRDRPRAPGR